MSLVGLLALAAPLVGQASAQSLRDRLRARRRSPPPASPPNDGGNDGHSSTATTTQICRASAFSSGTSSSRDVFVNFGVELGANLCGDSGSVEVEVIVNETAKAMAEAVVHTSVMCEGDGNGSGTAYGRSETNATANAGAIAEGWASVETCNGCIAAAGILVESLNTTFVSALAESKSTIEDYASERDPRQRSLKREEIRHDIQVSLIPVLAQVVARVSSNVWEFPDGREEQCAAVVDGCVSTGSAYGCCNVLAGSINEIIEDNADAEVDISAEVVGLACLGSEEEVIDQANATVEATAYALAAALSLVDIHCNAQNDALACAWGNTTIYAVAEAEALAFANAFAEADNGCGCNVYADVLTDALTTVYVAAISGVLGDVCVVGTPIGTTAGVEVVAAAISEGWGTAIATAIAEAVAAGDGCFASVGSCAIAEGELEVNAGCCEVEIGGVAETYAKDALADAVAEAEAYVCNSGKTIANATSAAEAIAEVWAHVVIEVVNECEAEGDAFACGFADGSITALANATATAFATSWAFASSTCEKPDDPKWAGCESEVATLVEAVGTVLATATIAITSENCAVDGEPYTDARWKEDFDENWLAALATAFAEAAVAAGDGEPVCRATVNACGEAGDSDACCSVKLVHDAIIDESHKYAEAVTDATTYLCTGAAEADSSAAASTTAEAYVSLLITIDGDCKKSGDSTVCVWLDSEVTAAANATAHAYAAGWAANLAECGCQVDVEAAVEAFGSVLLSLTQSVQNEFCLGDEPFVENVVLEYVESAWVQAIAESYSAIKKNLTDADNAACSGIVDVTASVGPVVAPEAAPEAPAEAPKPEPKPAQEPQAKPAQEQARVAVSADGNQAASPTEASGSDGSQTTDSSSTGGGSKRRSAREEQNVALN